ncbi:MAG: hypothetical protein ACKVT1_17005 [Dehalococcoidia bacterium]
MDATDTHWGALPTQRKTGAEPFTSQGSTHDLNLLGFWQWSASDLVSNATRGVLAEYIVARALGVDATGVRDEWAAFDLTTSSGIRVEVKSAAYIQSWGQRTLSRVTFQVRKSRGWDAPTGTYAVEARRHADVYVFALLAHQDKPTINPLNLDQWRFYVLPTTALDERQRSQHSITLPSLDRLAGGSVGFGELPKAVDAAAPRG